MAKVKICGITNLEDALSSIKAGCDALGFAFFKKSPRYIEPEHVREIVAKLPADIIKIGVFVDAREKDIRNISKMCKLDMLQFHGRETPDFCKRFKGCKIIKAFRVKDEVDPRRISKYKAFAYLFDTYVKSKAGGTGKRFDWKLIRHIGKLNRPVFLSGGLTAGNVESAIKIACPDWVDVCSYVESKPGKKDHKKIKKFIAAAKKRAGC
jgi:phosphoribosylanthranilate isomerase